MKRHKQKTKNKILSFLLIPVMAIFALFSSGTAFAASYITSVHMGEGGSPNTIMAGGYVGYCLQHSVVLPDGHEYIDSAQTVPNLAAMEAIVRRAYPVYNGMALGFLYLGDSSYTDLEAHEATQVAIWMAESPAEPIGTFSTNPRVNSLATAIYSGTLPTLNPDNWLSIDASSADIVTIGEERTSYGPITIAIDTGNAALDLAMSTIGISLHPVGSFRDPSFVFSESDSVDGAEAFNLRGGDYYVNFDNDDGIDTTLMVMNHYDFLRSEFVSFDVIEGVPDPLYPGMEFQLIGIVRTNPFPNPSVDIFVEPKLPEEPEVPEVPQTGSISENPTMMISSISIFASAAAIITIFALNRAKKQHALRNTKITRIRK